MRIDRRLTKDQSDPYDGIDFVERTSKITNADGSVVSRIERVLAPYLISPVAMADEATSMPKGIFKAWG